MGTETKIAWTRSTLNPWIGCTKVSPGCDNCYAEALDKRHLFGNGATHWGSGVDRHRSKSESTWAKPHSWNRLALWELENGKVATQFSGKWDKPGFWPVFCSSLADVFDREVPNNWRDPLWQTIQKTPYLSWLLVTKRISNVANMVPSHWMNSRFPENVRIIISVVNQAEADRDIPRLLALDCKNGVSYEPALGPVNWEKFLALQCDNGSVPAPGGGKMCPRCEGTAYPGCRGLEWIIIGGESAQGGAKARPFDIQWARDAVLQCKAAGVPVFVKQIGSNPLGWCRNILEGEEGGRDDPDFCDNYEAHEQSQPCSKCVYLENRAGADPSEWPLDLRVREFP